LNRIFLIEDNPAMIDLISNLLKEINCEIIHFKEGKSAYDSLPELKPDLVLCDLFMPGYDGFKFLQEVKSSSSFRSLPVVVLSAVADKNIIDEVLQNGADYFFTKPFRVAELYNTIRKIIGDE